MRVSPKELAQRKSRALPVYFPTIRSGLDSRYAVGHEHTEYVALFRVEGDYIALREPGRVCFLNEYVVPYVQGRLHAARHDGKHAPSEKADYLPACRRYRDVYEQSQHTDEYDRKYRAQHPADCGNYAAFFFAGVLLREDCFLFFKVLFRQKMISSPVIARRSPPGRGQA